MSEADTSSHVRTVTVKARSWLTGKWSPLCRITESTPGKRWSDICRPDGPGAYRLIALDADAPGIVPAWLDRVCGVDPTGTLYIGSTSSLRRRLASLILRHGKRDPLLGSGSHAIVAPKLARRFGPQLLAISWQPSNGKWSPIQRERDLLSAYNDRFGELPPMNKQSGL
jgi:hypothetical protein